MSEISIEDVSKRFEEHLAIEDNNRIIFSGKFGTGKTYFLNKFFDDRETEYNKFIISPANYVVSSNEDIFELIKADIIKDLFLTGKVNIKKLPEDNTVQKISDFIEGNQFVLGNFLLNTVSKLNSTLSVPKEVIDMLGEVYNKYKSHKANAEIDNKTMSEEIADYWFATSEKIGQVYEHNYITKLINHFLDELTEKGKKKNVLVIDDLDRIDPDHIFRILNILSAHNNQFGAENKFIFDHVVIVCDIDNIRKIFNHKYGADVDFDGYMDKFYSADYFIFRNFDAVNFYIDSFSEEFESDEEKCFVKLIYQTLSMQNIITLRKLLKHKIDFSIPCITLLELEIEKSKSNFHLSQIVSENISTLKLTTLDLRILQIFKLLNISLGSLKSLIEKIQVENNYYKIHFIGDSIFEKAFRYLAFQNYLVKHDNILLFFKTGDSYNSYTQTSKKELVALQNEILGVHFSIQTKWNEQVKYSGQYPFFNEAIITKLESTSGDAKYKAEEFWKILLQTLNSAKSKKYLEKVGVVY